MKAINISGDQLECLIEDAIFYDDNTFRPITGDFSRGFVLEKRMSIDQILENGWSVCYPSLKSENEELVALAGETSWGGTGFVALKLKHEQRFKWLMHLSTMNNPIHLSIDGDNIHLTTDLNYPEGVDFVIPMERPENLQVKARKTKNP